MSRKTGREIGRDLDPGRSARPRDHAGDPAIEVGQGAPNEVADLRQAAPRLCERGFRFLEQAPPFRHEGFEFLDARHETTARTACDVASILPISGAVWQ